MKWLKRIVDYYNDKILACKCGLEVKDICVHEPDISLRRKGGCIPDHDKCIKCREFYR